MIGVILVFSAFSLGMAGQMIFSIQATSEPAQFLHMNFKRVIKRNSCLDLKNAGMLGAATSDACEHNIGCARCPLLL